MEHKSVNTLNALSENYSYNESTGAITANGGISTRKNIYVGYEVNCNELISRDDCRIGGNLYLCGDIQSKHIKSENNNLLINKNIIPECKIYNIGSKDQKWNNIFANNITIGNSIYTEGKSIIFNNNTYFRPENIIIREDTNIYINSSIIILENISDRCLTVEIETDNLPIGIIIEIYIRRNSIKFNNIIYNGYIKLYFDESNLDVLDGK